MLTNILRFLKLFLGLKISFGTLVCKLGNKNVLLTLFIFGGFFSNFQFSIFTENGNFHFFPKIVSATCFVLITHIIKLFQTVQI